MKTTRETKIITHGNHTLVELKAIHGEGIGYTEYKKLLKEYIKLSKRFSRVIKVSDSHGNGLMDKNDNLEGNLNYTIKKAREKLMENVTEHRKTKEFIEDYKVKYQNALEIINKYDIMKRDLEKLLDTYIEKYGKIDLVYAKKEED